MAISSLSLVLGIIGAALAIAHEVQRWLEKRAEGTVDEHRLDVEGLRTLTGELRTELTEERKLRRQAEQDLSDERSLNRARIADLEAQLEDVRKDLRKAHDTIDKIQVAREMKR